MISCKMDENTVKTGKNHVNEDTLKCTECQIKKWDGYRVKMGENHVKRLLHYIVERATDTVEITLRWTLA